MENNLISDEERRKEKEKMNRLMNLKILTKSYSWIKMDITWTIERHQRSWCVYRSTRNIKWNGQTSMEIH